MTLNATSSDTTFSLQCPRVVKFSLSGSTASHSWGNSQFEPCALNSKMTLNTRSGMIYMLLWYPWVPNFNYFSSKTCCFVGVAVNFEKSAAYDLKIILNYKVQGTPYIFYKYHSPQSPKFQSVSLYNSFWVTGPFNTIAPNDPNMILNTMRSKVPHYSGTVKPVLRYHCHEGPNILGRRTYRQVYCNPCLLTRSSRANK